MPVTISHPVISIPLQRTGLVLSALIIGSLMPDFEFFLRLSDGRVIGHTFTGMFLFCIPVGMLVLLVFHKLIKFPLLSLVPHNHQLRLYTVARDFKFFPLRRFLNIVLSLAVGTLSHLIADGFTHHDGFFVKLFPILNHPVLNFPQGIVRVYFLLQYVFSIFGAAMMVYWYLKWYYSTEPKNEVIPHRFHISGKVGIAIAMLSFALTSGITYGLLLSEGKSSVELAKSIISLSAVATASGFMVALVCFGIMWHFFIPHHKRLTVVNKEEKKENLIHVNEMVS